MTSGPPPSQPRSRGLFAPSQVRLKSVLTVCAGVVFVAALIFIAWRTGGAILLTIAALLVAIPLDRGVRMLSRHGVPRPVAVAALLLLLLAVLTGIGWLILPPAIHQGERLFGEGPALIERLQQSALYQRVDAAVDVDAVVDQVREGIRNNPTVVAGQALSVARATLAAIAGLVVVLFVATFMLIDGSGVVRWVLAQTRSDRRPRYRHALERIYHALGGYVAGAAALVLANATVTTCFLALLGVPYFLPLGVLCGLASLVPVLGVTLAGVVVAVVATASQGVAVGVATVIYMIVYQQVENHLLSPLVYRRTISLNPLLSILAVIFMGELIGIAGAVLAVPTLAVARAVVTELLALRQERNDPASD